MHCIALHCIANSRALLFLVCFNPENGRPLNLSTCADTKKEEVDEEDKEEEEEEEKEVWEEEEKEDNHYHHHIRIPWGMQAMAQTQKN